MTYTTEPDMQYTPGTVAPSTIEPIRQSMPDDYRITIPNMEAIPEGYAYAGLDEYENNYAAPDNYSLNSLDNFSSNLADPSLVTSSPETVRYLNDERYSTLNTAGISTDPSKGQNLRPIGVDLSGRQMFGVQNMMTSADPDLGSKGVDSFVQMSSGFDTSLKNQTFDFDELTQFKMIADNSRDPAVISSLNESKAAGDSESFIDKVIDFFTPGKTKVTNQAAAAGKGPKGDESKGSLMDSLSTAYQAYSLFEMWDYMSPAQQASGLATVGLKGFELATGEKLGNKILVEGSLNADGSQLTPALTLGNAVDLFALGVNAYSLAKNWNQLSDVSKIVSGVRTVNSIANVAKSMNLLGSGTTGAAVAVNSGQLAAAGFSAAPHMGVGAIVGPASSVPAGYTVVASHVLADGTAGVSAIPTSNAGTAAGAQSSAGSMLGTAAGVAGIAYGAYQIYEGWGTGGEEGAINGAVGGASMAAGMYALGATNPYLLAAVVVVAAVSGLIKTGKHGDQVKRDGVRARFKEIGVIDDNWSIKLADGSRADVGADGNSGRHEFLHPKKAKKYGADLEKGERGNLAAYDVDYTNDVTFMASLGGIAISRVVCGGAAQNVDQFGGQLTNAFVSNVGYEDGVLTEEKFRKTMANQRVFMAQLGIKSRSDAFALANQLYAEGRVDDTQLVQMHQAFNMMYRHDNFEYAQTLLEGRWKGIEVANEKKDVEEKDRVRMPRGERKRPPKPQAAPEEEDEAQLV